jgi:hypothetical protein
MYDGKREGMGLDWTGLGGGLTGYGSDSQKTKL